MSGRNRFIPDEILIEGKKIKTIGALLTGGRSTAVRGERIAQHQSEREPNAEVLIKIALYFGVSTDYLLGVPAKEKTLSSVDDDKVEALAERLFSLGENELLQLSDYLDFLEWKLNLKRD